ncbi:MAG: Glutathione S-transferase, omega, partial [uncultured Rubrobacteraceae bacterium]
WQLACSSRGNGSPAASGRTRKAVSTARRRRSASGSPPTGRAGSRPRRVVITCTLPGPAPGRTGLRYCAGSRAS